MNLISNALKFTNPGGCVYVNIFKGSEPDMINFEIKDTGSGMSKETVKNLGQEYKTFG